MRLMMRPETKKRTPNGTITAAAEIAIPKKRTQPWEREREIEREIHRIYFEKWGFFLLLCIMNYGNK